MPYRSSEVRWPVLFLVLKSVISLEWHPGALNSSWTLANVVLAKSLSALLREVAISYQELHDGVCGDVALTGLFTFQSACSWSAWCLECVKSIDSTVSVHRCLCFSFSLQSRLLAALSLSMLASASARGRSRFSHSSSQQGA